jgi:hypothetical protein
MNAHVEALIKKYDIENDIIKEDDKLILTRNRLFIVSSAYVIPLASLRSVGIRNKGFMETDDYLLFTFKGGKESGIPFPQVMIKSQSLGMIGGNVGGAYSHTNVVNPLLHEWVAAINETRLKLTEADIAEWKQYEEERQVEEAKQQLLAEDIANKKKEYEASPAGIAEKKAESRKMFRRGAIVVCGFVILIVGLLVVTQQKRSTEELPTVSGDGATLKSTEHKTGPDWSKPLLGATSSISHKKETPPKVAERPAVHQTFVRFRFASGQLLLLRLENPSHSATESFPVNVGDTVSFARARVNSYGDEWYEFVLPDNREGRNLRNGVIIAKFDSLVYH